MNPILDQVLTGFILIGGADRIGEVLKWSGVQARPLAEKSSSQPIEITGKLTLQSSGKDATLFSAFGARLKRAADGAESLVNNTTRSVMLEVSTSWGHVLHVRRGVWHRSEQAPKNRWLGIGVGELRYKGLVPIGPVLGA